MASLDAILWGAATLAYGLGDYLTTVLGVRMAGVQEGNPIVRLISGGDPGPGSFAVLKLVSVALFFAAYWILRPGFTRLVVPAALTLLGTVVTVRNVRIIRRRS
ncbi:hypothetical protein E6P09_03895 [Haloferax mediterranei ATCC 33500]|uniref:DUF5658 domain-containing protein n=1 Tax=Haloferax mediterranei (strain ATCC 33500 / DSM 1411 / JCM 8866 / NBRC 14739 / NCIMB 2177 / R-4) TaxID=523841 RepID=I3R0Z0_HALMT|nr:DUF5658 family protein [Haloferax mediterranei]AFK17900.1 hypothetical protein HFX_0159 [Haloferax mediterranei ATCC 33500]AHZ22676.1 hypothetical protein BM92_08470 [Haloferax mediterranei ATCC 33500]EMA02825.1 hypothetical protein C439_09590 [Haloferax mediterranei ATCC 33500]MDX5987991.1 DUF5658 family protein [Haloferax mediterranei ATCC 33500]QCQ74457.1 hypothetical protein E6P09_03895 [Haloferax mediterranei ATCC 33500]